MVALKILGHGGEILGSLIQCAANLALQFFAA